MGVFGRVCSDGRDFVFLAVDIQNISQGVVTAEVFLGQLFGDDQGSGTDQGGTGIPPEQGKGRDRRKGPNMNMNELHDIKTAERKKRLSPKAAWKASRTLR